MSTNDIFMQVRKKLEKNSPEILVGLGISGMILTTIEAVRVTPKAMTILEDYRYENDLNYDDPIPAKVIVKSCWRVYAPAFILGVCSVGSIFGSLTITHRRSVALAAAYGLAEKTLDSYKEKIIETLGEDTHQKLEDAIYKDRVQQGKDDYEGNKIDIYDTHNGDEIFMDCASGRFFLSSELAIRAAEVEYNRVLNNDGYTTLNELYDLLGLDNTDAGNALGHDRCREALNIRLVGSGIRLNHKPVTIIKYDFRALYNCESYYT